MAGGDNMAILMGYTREVYAHCGSSTLHLFIRPNTDLDTRFPAWDADMCEWVSVNGYACNFEDIDQT